VWDADGRQYLDYLGSWGPLILGHSPESVGRAVRRAVRAGSSFGAPTEWEVGLAELVQDAFPGMERMRFVSSGTEACMSAIRLARGCTGRRIVVKFAGCYHGHSDGLLVAAGSGATTFGRPTSAGVLREIARWTVVLPYNDGAAVDRFFRKSGRDVAAVIVEPVAGNMGVVAPDLEFLGTLRRLTAGNGSVLIFDEVITGFRLCWGGAQHLYNIKPDLTCLGKIVGGGLPVGVFGGRRTLMDRLAPMGPVYQAGTLSGNPAAMAAGIAVLGKLRSLSPYRSLQEKTALLVGGIKDSAARAGVPVRVNSVGSMLTVFMTDRPVSDYETALRSDTRRYASFFNGLLGRGVYFPPAQFEAAFVSTTHRRHDIEKTIDIIDLVFKKIKRKG